MIYSMSSPVGEHSDIEVAFAPHSEPSWGEIGAGGRAAVSAQLEGVRALLGGRADSLEAMLARVE